MNKSELVAAVAASAGISQAKAAQAVAAMTDQITNAMARGDTVSLIGFGTFSQRARSARTGKNPQTGATIQIAASKSVGFKPGKALKDAVNYASA
jgi:nucleoid DNA-binding protein